MYYDLDGIFERLTDTSKEVYTFDEMVEAIKEIEKTRPNAYQMILPFFLTAIAYLDGRLTYSQFIQMLFAEAEIIDKLHDEFEAKGLYDGK